MKSLEFRTCGLDRLALSAVLTLAAVLTQASYASAAPGRACFRVTNGAPSGQPDQTFVIALKSAAQIEQAQKIVSGSVTDQVHVQGLIKVGKAPYNKKWRFYLNPNSITFFTFAPTVCGRAMSTTDIETLVEAGKAPTPTGVWCPWMSKVTVELPVGPHCPIR